MTESQAPPACVNDWYVSWRKSSLLPVAFQPLLSRSGSAMSTNSPSLILATRFVITGARLVLHNLPNVEVPGGLLVPAGDDGVRLGEFLSTSATEVVIICWSPSGISHPMAVGPSGGGEPSLRTTSTPSFSAISFKICRLHWIFEALRK